ncbi:glutathione S-transferase family protein [Sphingobium sufflavum]|uniref:glutathione S-transferase family protein n=1 Tax=Sphingobium sufflavum TaxID=1129547 RepID=UPI001F1B7889|nr:glutathione S-transferase family protein [Sphingobium sufflavum]MCE7797043.1 glutathione S-transferase family protein [Sphingobium sufflavum]
MLTIWGRLNSHNVKKVVWLAEELGLPFVRHDVGGSFGMDAAYCARNPNALIPTIDDGDLTLWESNAILRYLAARHGGADWWPADPAVRAQGDKWMDWQFGLADAQRDAFLHLVRKSASDRDPAKIAESARNTATLMTIADDCLSRQPWLSGAALGIGDIPVGAYAHTFFTLDMERPELPHLRAWYERLTRREAYARIVMIPLT